LQTSEPQHTRRCWGSLIGMYGVLTSDDMPPNGFAYRVFDFVLLDCFLNSTLCIRRLDDANFGRRRFLDPENAPSRKLICLTHRLKHSWDVSTELLPAKVDNCSCANSYHRRYLGLKYVGCALMSTLDGVLVTGIPVLFPAGGWRSGGSVTGVRLPSHSHIQDQDE
jgi:hypothetical protein